MSFDSDFIKKVPIMKRAGVEPDVSDLKHARMAEDPEQEEKDKKKSPQFLALRELVFAVLGRVKDSKDVHEIADRVVFGDGRIIPSEAGDDASQAIGAAIVVVVQSSHFTEEDYAVVVGMLNELSICHWDMRSFEPGEGSFVGIYVLDTDPELLTAI
jgi:hypothetical protein